MNPVLQCALGINTDPGNPGRKSTLVKLGTIFIAVILLWVIFFVLSSIVSGIFIYVLLFPVSYMVYNGLEFLVFRYVLKEDSGDGCSVRFPGGITATALFICLNVANNFIEAAALSFGFASGILLVFLVLFEIRRRAELEEVPRFLRGKPLILISMGMLSLVFSTVSLLLFRMIGS
jgi:electron transport complex protein RnfA